MTMSNNFNGNGQNLGDTTLTKVFVGGLAWETPKEALKAHFDKYGHILEAVIIQDKATARSKGYGFVTFKDPEAANRACEDASPIINGRRANCNLASLGTKRPARVPTAPVPPQQGGNNGGGRANAGGHVQWYYPPRAAPPFHRHHHQAVPFYGYPQAYLAADMSYNHKMGYTGGSYMNGHFSQVYPGQPIINGNALVPMYPMYHFHQQQTMCLPAQMYPTTVGPMVLKPTSIAPNTVCLAVE